MIKACIFDMDGTTVNTINSIAYFANNALNKFNLPSIDTERYKILVGNGAKVLIERSISESGGSPDLLEKVLPEYNSTYDNNFLYLTEPYEGIVDLLKELKKRGITVAILSNKPDSTAKKVSEALFGDELVDYCLGGVDGIALKPSPEGLEKLLKDLNLNREECLYIGDTSTDMQTGKNGKMYTIGVLWGFRGREELESSGADVIISHPSEIIDIIDKH